MYYLGLIPPLWFKIMNQSSRDTSKPLSSNESNGTDSYDDSAPLGSCKRENGGVKLDLETFQVTAAGGMFSAGI